MSGISDEALRERAEWICVASDRRVEEKHDDPAGVIYQALRDVRDGALADGIAQGLMELAQKVMQAHELALEAQIPLVEKWSAFFAELGKTALANGACQVSQEMCLAFSKESEEAIRSLKEKS